MLYAEHILCILLKYKVDFDDKTSDYLSYHEFNGVKSNNGDLICLIFCKNFILLQANTNKSAVFPPNFAFRRKKRILI